MKRNLIIFRSCLGILALAPLPANARPISYQGGWTVIEDTDRQSTSLLAHYTPDPKWSVGLRSEWDRNADILIHGAQATYLVNRWFGKDYQANLYAFGGGGLAKGIDSNPAPTDGAVMAGIMADWETRRWFVSYKARAMDAGSVDKSFMQAGRIGLAPYIGKTDDLHTWVMLEVDHRPDNAEPLGITPLVRLFKGAAMFEAGWSLSDDQPLLNFAYRF